LASTNLAAFAGLEEIVATAAGCSAHLKSYDKLLSGGAELAVRTFDVTEFVANLIAREALPRLARGEKEVVVHDPCHLRHAQRITSAPRVILEAAGYRLVDADPEGICCGAAGIYSVLRPEASHQLGERIGNLLAGHQSRLVASANPGCEMQLRAHTSGAFRIAHPVELYLEAIRSQDDHVPGR
jgi:glycolate oxidase iron-sulfur subunit